MKRIYRQAASPVTPHRPRNPLFKLTGGTRAIDRSRPRASSSPPVAKSAGKPTSRPPPSTPSSLASRAAVAGSRGDAPRPSSLYAASFRSTRGTSPRLDGCIFLSTFAPLVVVSRVSSSSRRLGWVRETDRIASRTARPDDDGGDLCVHTSRDAARANHRETTTVSRGGNISRLDASRDLSRWFARDASSRGRFRLLFHHLRRRRHNAEGGG